MWGKKCLFFNIQKGVECEKNWQTVIDHMVENIDFSNTKLFVTDMNQSIKKLLKRHFPSIPCQNCMFHRIESITSSLAIKPFLRRQHCSQYYKRIKTAETKDEIISILDEFKNFDYRTRLDNKRKENKRQNKNIDRMLNTFYEENFTFLEFPELSRNISMTTNEVESFHSALKTYLERCLRGNEIEELTWKTMMYLNNCEYLLEFLLE